MKGGGVVDPTILILVLKRNFFLLGGYFSFFWWVGGVPTPKKIVINLPGTYEKLPCKGEPNQFSG